jgi:hypothetical protein
MSAARQTSPELARVVPKFRALRRCALDHELRMEDRPHGCDGLPEGSLRQCLIELTPDCTDGVHAGVTLCVRAPRSSRTVDGQRGNAPGNGSQSLRANQTMPPAAVRDPRPAAMHLHGGFGDDHQCPHNWAEVLGGIMVHAGIGSPSSCTQVQWMRLSTYGPIMYVRSLT